MQEECKGWMLNCAGQHIQIRVRSMKLNYQKLPALFTEYSARSPCITSTMTISTYDSQTGVVDLVIDSIYPALKHLCMPFQEHCARNLQPGVCQIQVVGCLSANVSLHDRSVPAMFFIVDKGTRLIGRDLMSALYVRIENNQVLPPNALPGPCSPVPVLQCMVA